MLIYYRGETRTIRAVLRGDDGAPLESTGMVMLARTPTEAERAAIHEWVGQL